MFLNILSPIISWNAFHSGPFRNVWIFDHLSATKENTRRKKFNHWGGGEERKGCVNERRKKIMNEYSLSFQLMAPARFWKVDTHLGKWKFIARMIQKRRKKKKSFVQSTTGQTINIFISIPARYTKKKNGRNYQKKKKRFNDLYISSPHSRILRFFWFFNNFIFLIGIIIYPLERTYRPFISKPLSVYFFCVALN